VKFFKILPWFTLISMGTLLITSSQATVKYDDINKGEVLFTRGCSQKDNIAWVNRFNVTTIDKDGNTWGVLERATVKDPKFRTLTFKQVKKEKFNMVKICKSGGCYTKEEEAFSDVKRWMVFGCK